MACTPLVFTFIDQESKAMLNWQVSSCVPRKKVEEDTSGLCPKSHSLGK